MVLLTPKYLCVTTRKHFGVRNILILYPSAFILLESVDSFVFGLAVTRHEFILSGASQAVANAFHVAVRSINAEALLLLDSKGTRNLWHKTGTCDDYWYSVQEWWGQISVVFLEHGLGRPFKCIMHGLLYVWHGLTKLEKSSSHKNSDHLHSIKPAQWIVETMRLRQTRSDQISNRLD